MCRIFWSSYSSFIQRSGPIRQFGSRPLKIRANDAVMLVEARARAVCDGQLGGYRSHWMPPAGYAGELSNLGNQVVGAIVRLNLTAVARSRLCPPCRGQRQRQTRPGRRASPSAHAISAAFMARTPHLSAFRGRPRRQGGVPCRDVPVPALVGGIIPERRAASPGISTSRLSVVVTRQILIMAVPHAARAQTRRGGCGFAFAAGAAPRSAPALQ